MHKLSRKQISRTVNLAAKSLFDYCKEYNRHYLVTGSSGGLDSAVTLALAERACRLAKKNGFLLVSAGLVMPCHSKPDAERLGREAIKKFNAREIRIDLSGAYDFLSENYFAGANKEIKKILKATGGDYALRDWEWSEKIAEGNIKSRLRMICGTYHIARMMKGLVLSTDNLSEYWMAFWTMHGDVGDFGMIQNIMKGLELYNIARYLKVPAKIISARPDDGLGIAGGDEDQIGAAYPAVDKIMIKLIQAGFDQNGVLSQLDNLPDIGVSKELVLKIASRALKGSFKRRGSLNLSRKSLGLPEIKKIKLD